MTVSAAVLEISAERMVAELDRLGAVTATPGEGITRLAYSPEEREAHRLIELAFAEAGLEVRTDPAGNLIGRLSGRTSGPAVLTGSHLDSVRGGGRFDGAAGVIAALECARAITKAARRNRLPIEFVCFAAEESARFGPLAHRVGSRAMAGLLDGFDPDAVRDAAGVTLSEAMAQVGLEARDLAAAARRREEVKAYLELHIEQGRQLARAGLPVGAVTAIVGTSRVEVELRGRADHSGGTPMGERRDALAAAAELVLAVELLGQKAAGAVVATVGTLDIEPGSISVVPGRALLGVDVRSLDRAARKAAVAAIEDSAAAIGARREVGVKLTSLRDDDPTELSTQLQEVLDRARARSGIRSMRLASQTGHDAMSLARLTETGMVFVRNPSGRSHCPEETVDVQDLVAGTRVLLAALLEIAGEEAS